MHSAQITSATTGISWVPFLAASGQRSRSREFLPTGCESLCMASLLHVCGTLCGGSETAAAWAVPAVWVYCLELPVEHLPPALKLASETKHLERSTTSHTAAQRPPCLQGPEPSTAPSGAELDSSAHNLLLCKSVAGRSVSIPGKPTSPPAIEEEICLLLILWLRDVVMLDARSMGLNLT